MKRAVWIAAVLLLLLLPRQAAGQIPGLTDHWWEAININGQAVFIDRDRVWSRNGRVFAIVRIVKVVNGTADYTSARDQVAATDCRRGLGIFRTSDNYNTAPLQYASGVAYALVGAVCSAYRNQNQ